MPQSNLKRFFSRVVVTITSLILLASGPVFAEENPNVSPEPTPQKSIWEDATILKVVRSEYTAGLSSVPRRAERFFIASKVFVYQVEARRAWARNKPAHLAPGSHVLVKFEKGQFLLKTKAGVVYPMVVVEQSLKP